MCEAMGDSRADQFSPDQFAEYRTRRIGAGISPNTMNREQAYLRAVFNETIRLGHWKKENPLKKLRAFKIQEKELSYLERDQTAILIAQLDKSKNLHVSMVAKVCLATGARWGEAESLRASQIRNGMIQFVQTKSNKARAVPITADLEDHLKKHQKSLGEEEYLFSSSYAASREALTQTKLKLSQGQLTHILRHTFASHFIMNGGNILALQKILGTTASL